MDQVRYEVIYGNSVATVMLNNCVIERFPEGYIISADNHQNIIYNSDIEKMEDSEKQTIFWAKCGIQLVYSWT